MIEERAALNIAPKDGVEIDGNWWMVTDHSFSSERPAPVMMRLVSRDREFISIIATNPSHMFRCEPHCC